MGKIRLVPGDVLRAGSGQGKYAYVQYLGRHPQYGDTIAVHPCIVDAEADVSTLFSNAYVAFYPAASAVNRGFVERAGHVSPLREIPSVVRRPGARGQSGVESWVIETEGSELLKTKLTSSERRLPIASIWNHELLLLRINQRWVPESED
jgi:hypothetical protein